MAEPTYTWTLRITAALAERVRLALIDPQSGYSAWIRQAIEEKLERDERKAS